MSKPVWDSGTKRAAGRGIARRAARLAVRTAVGLCMLATVAAGGPQAHAQQKTDLVFSEQDGYARMVFSFANLPKYKIEATNSVLVIAFDEPIDVGDALKELKEQQFIVAGRLDPNRTTLRFALSRSLRANTTEAGDQLFVDLLPETWKGPPPNLPAEVIADLAARAKKADELANRNARLKAAEDRNRRVNVRIGEHPTFTRLQFDWRDPPKAKLSRVGNVITLNFDKVAKPLMGRLMADPPKFVRSADFENADDGLVITLSVDPVMDIRGFREGNSYILDIADPFGLSYANDLAKKLGFPGAAKPSRREPVTEIKSDRDPQVVKPGKKSDRAPMAAPEPPAAAADAKPVKKQAGKTQDAKPAASTKASREPAAKTVARVEPKTEDPLSPGYVPRKPDQGVKQSARENKLGFDVPTVVISEKPLDHNGLASTPDKQTATLATALPAMPKGGSDAAQKPGTAAAPKTESRVSAAAPGKKAPAAMAGKTAGGKVLHRWEFSKPVAAAIFERADYLWLRFETDEPVDVAALQQGSPSLFGKPMEVVLEGKRFHRVPLKTDLVITAAAHGNAWSIGLDKSGRTRGEAIALKKGVRSDGLLKVTANASNIGSVSRVQDPVVGDLLYVVSAFGPGTMHSTSHDYVEFSTLPSMHGMVIQPHSDDLAVRVVRGRLLITRRDGLTLSSGKDGLSSKRTFDRADSKSFGGIDFFRWSTGGPDALHEHIAQLEQGIASLPDFQAVGLRMELAQYYLAKFLGPEALGQLRLVAESDPDVAARPIFYAMRAIAHVMMHRPEEARKDISRRGVGSMPQMVLWTATMEAQSENWPVAAEKFRVADTEISKYPEEMQIVFRLHSATAAVETKDWAGADLQLKAMPVRLLVASQEAETLLLNGRMFEGLGRNDEALAAYEMAIETRERKAEAAATFYKTRLQQRLNRIEKDEAIQKYEMVAIMWRGDRLELNTLQKLAELYVDIGNYRRSLEIMKTAVVNFPRSKYSVDVLDRMNMVYRELYLNGKADQLPPIKALSLYYDYRELTPVGRLGDEMIRKLSDRLIKVDLLDKAAEILAHQVDKRLTGAARAQVAAKLATVYMLDRKPQKALEIIRRTRQAVLPRKLLRQRRILEARALSELGRDKQAVDLLSSFEGPDIDRARAEAYWKNERWLEAGESFERMLAPIENKTTALSDEQRIDVMKGAISYSLSNDAIGLDRFKEKYAKRMSESKDARAFEVVTDAIDRRGVDFANLASEIAGIDTLEKFLTEFRESLDSLGDLSGEGQTNS